MSHFDATGEFTRSDFCHADWCVEVAVTAGGVVMRDSKPAGNPLLPASPRLRFSSHGWAEFVDLGKAGHFSFDGIPWVVVIERHGRVFLSGRTADVCVSRDDALCFDAAEWGAFIQGLRLGKFDRTKLAMRPA